MTEEINLQTESLKGSLGLNKTNTDRFTGTIKKTDEQTEVVRNSFISLQKAIEGLSARINRTTINYTKNDEGRTTGFDLRGGISKGDASYYAKSFATGGIVNKPTNAIVGDVPGGEAIIPLRDFPKLLSSGRQNNVKNIEININPTITIENNGEQLSTEDIKEEIIDKVNEEMISKIREVIE